MADEQDTPAEETPEAEAPATGGDELGPAGAKALEQERAARKEEQRARKALERELETLRRQSMTESEKAVAEAEARGRSAAQVDFGKRLVRSEFAAAAARRNAEFDVASALELLDLTRLVTDDGEPDGKAIAAAVERLVPAGSTAAPSFDGGARTSVSTGSDMSALIRRATGRV